MAITNAQQYQQLVNKPANGKRPGYRGPGGYQGSSGSSSSSSSSSSGSSGSNQGPAGGASAGGNYGGNRNPNQTYGGGNGGNQNQFEINRKAKLEKEAKKAADEKAARDREDKARQAQEAFAKRVAKEKREREEKEAKDLSNLGKSTTTKFGTTTKPGTTRSPKQTGIATTTTPNRFLTDTYLDERLGYVDQFGNPIGNTLDAKFASLSTPTKTTDGITSVVGGDITDDIREQYGVLRSTTPKGKEVNISDVVAGALDGPLDKSSDLQTAINDLQTGRYNPDLDDLMPGDEFTPKLDVALNKREKILQDFKDRKNEVKAFTPLMAILKNPLQKFADFSAEKNRTFFEDVIRAGKIPGLSFDMSAKDLEKAYKGYLSDRSAGKIDAYGNTLGDFRRENIGGQSVIMGGGGGGGAGITSATPTSSLTPVEEEVDNRTELEKLLDARGAAYRFFADGGRVPAMAGGIMNTDVIGGAADGNIDEMGRQMYFVGKLVKKATNAVKKIVKSPVGKIALLTAGAGLFGAGPAAGLFGSGKGLAFKNFLGKGLLKKGMTDFSLANISPMKAIGLASLTPLLFQGEEEEEQQYEGPSIDIPGIRRDPYRAMGETYRFYAEGGKAEPVAKKTMPLIDMDGKEMDLRNEGGFVPLGRMERADDVPARLSKNEFVFTADAVRNAGEGDIDKGAEVMYNMMKNLESGGEVSEESQGLDGAREMFKTSQRLEEVL